MDEDSITVDFSNWQIKPPYHKFVWSVIKSVGWYIIGIAVVFIYAWPYIERKYNTWKKKIDDREYEIKYCKDVDFNTKRLLAFQSARDNMQIQYLKRQEIALRKEKEKKEKNKLKSPGLQSDVFGYRLGDNSENGDSTSSRSKSFKKDYNLLTGDGASGRYVPPKRSFCAKGGCK